MSKALTLHARQVTAICKGAAKVGYIAEVKFGDVVIRLIPEGCPQSDGGVDKPVNPENFDTLDEYLAWRDRGGAGED